MANRRQANGVVRRAVVTSAPAPADETGQSAPEHVSAGVSRSGRLSSSPRRVLCAKVCITLLLLLLFLLSRLEFVQRFGTNDLQLIQTFLHSKLSLAGELRLEELRSQCRVPNLSVEERVNFYLGLWADCKDRACECDLAGAASVDDCLTLTVPKGNRPFCVGGGHWHPNPMVSAIAQLPFNWGDALYPSEVKRAIAAAPDSTDAAKLGFPFQYGDGVWMHGAVPVIMKARSVNTSFGSQAVLLKLNGQRHWDPLPSAFDSDVLPFREKIDRAVWRGASTGWGENDWRSGDTLFDKSKLGQRASLMVRLGRWLDSEVLDVGVTQYVQPVEPRFPTKPEMTMADQMRYKMIVMVEGNDVASGLKWALLSSSAVIMPSATIVTWAMETELVPWIHYIPIRQDCDDLEEKARWCLDHLAECEEIGRNGRCFAAQFLDAELESRIMGDVCVSSSRRHSKRGG